MSESSDVLCDLVEVQEAYLVQRIVSGGRLDTVEGSSALLRRRHGKKQGAPDEIVVPLHDAADYSYASELMKRS